MESEDGIGLNQEEINGKCKEADSTDSVGRVRYEYKFDNVKDKVVGML